MDDITRNIRILFLTEKEICHLLGGTERITETLSSEFMSRGIPCYSAYLYSAPKGMPLAEFTASRQMDLGKDISKQITSILCDFQITDCIINFVSHKSKVLIMPELYEVAKPLGVKVYFCYHAMPGEDFYGAPLAYSLYKIIHGYDIQQSLKDVLLSITPNCVWRPLMRKKYRVAYNNSDATVLLSNNFIPLYKQLAEIKENTKFSVIPNALSFTNFFSKGDIRKKIKEVLVIARMDERSKRISLSLKIWQQIEQFPELNEWHLTIIGGGHDLEYFRKMHKHLKLERCSLKGRVIDIMPYYEQASIFMMTSAYEGFGITLTEAQQNGVVPIVFNSYASLTDIITNEKDGIIIHEGDIEAYVNQLRKLMLDTEWRETLAIQALESSKRFKVENVINLWMRILEKKS